LTFLESVAGGTASCAVWPKVFNNDGTDESRFSALNHCLKAMVHDLG
jgi:hypothetical protein